MVERFFVLPKVLPLVLLRALDVVLIAILVVLVASFVVKVVLVVSSSSSVVLFKLQLILF